MRNDFAFDIALTSATTSAGIFPPEQQSIAYNAFDKVTSITEGVKTLQITYGHHRQRISQQYTEAGVTTHKVYAGACEYITKNTQTTTHTYLSGPEGLFALHVKNPNSTENIRYIHKDHLGSWNTISDENGNMLQDLSFDAWGNRRNPATWCAFTSTPPGPLFDRGFTGHEHLYGFQLINMNGRMYDPVVSRMLSPDNFVQAPDFSQSFNRYSYVMNNPINLIDLSGYTWQDYEGIPPDVDDELRAILEQSGYTFDEVVVTATHLNPMEEIWKMHDGFELDREYDEIYNSDKPQDLIYGWSVDFTFAVASIGYSVSLGEVFDNTSNKTKQYVTHGPAFGLELSAGLNFIVIKPKENFKFSDLEGKSWGVDVSYLIFLSWSGNSTPDVGGPSTFDSYNMYEFGLGPGFGFSNTPESNTRFVDWIPTRLWY